MRSRAIGLVMVTGMAILAAACASSSSSVPSGASGPSGSSNGQAQTYTIGLLTDSTGLAASSDATSVKGLRAGIALAASEGYRIKYVTADTGTSPAGALAAAQKLVSQDHVFAVISVSSLTFSAAPFLRASGVPVIGSDQDGPEWLSYPNMFSVFGRQDATRASTTVGRFMKMEGATDVGTLGYGITPLSADAAKSYALSAKAAGLKVGYVNANFPFGSTNVEPVVLAMKSAGVNGMTPSVTTGTSLALITALKQAGVKMKVSLLPTGYGGDLYQAGSTAAQDAQGAYFYLIYEPVEMHTAATARFQRALRSSGSSDEPTFAEYLGYAGVDMFVRGLQRAGAHPSQAAFISALRTVHDFDAAGLLGPHTVDLASQATLADGPDGCLYFTRLSRAHFELVHGADPLCGPELPGRVSSS
jgi:branched-chain amino acid transport system substrate-binding protein